MDAPSSVAELNVIVRPAVVSLLETVQCTVQVSPVMQEVWPTMMGWWADATPVHRPTEPMTAATTAAMKRKMRFTAILSGARTPPELRVALTRAGFALAPRGASSDQRTTDLGFPHHQLSPRSVAERLLNSG
jgi:hypothetical protein